MPFAAPSRMSDFTSSSETNVASAAPLPPKSLSTVLLDAVKIPTKNEVRREKNSIGRATERGQAREKFDRARDHEGDLLRVAERERFRHELAQNQREVGDRGADAQDGNRFRPLLRRRERNLSDDRLQVFERDGAADGGRERGHDRDADLDGREEAVGIVFEARHGGGRAGPFFQQGLDARLARGDDRDLGGGEKRGDQYEDENQRDLEPQGIERHRISPLRVLG